MATHPSKRELIVQNARNIKCTRYPSARKAKVGKLSKVEIHLKLECSTCKIRRLLVIKHCKTFILQKYNILKG
jgi:ribosomal protein L44E